MLGACILHYLHGCLQEGPVGGGVNCLQGMGMRHYNVRRCSHYYPDFGLNVCGTAYLHGTIFVLVIMLLTTHTKSIS